MELCAGRAVPSEPAAVSVAEPTAQLAGDDDRPDLGIEVPHGPRRGSLGGGLLETRPRVGFIPTRPHAAAGIRIDPPPSDPVAQGTIPAATAARRHPDVFTGGRESAHESHRDSDM
jgi:hypothetical protein